MTLYAIVAYLRYRWRAKGRHGTHSPFVYGFIENVVLNDSGDVEMQPMLLSGIALKYEKLVNRIVHQYNYKSVWRMQEANPAAQYDLLVVSSEEPERWKDSIEKHRSAIKNGGCMVVCGIHQTPSHTNAWKEVIQWEKTLLSLDVYGIGLLFFREEFKEKQHFVIRY